MRFFSFLGSISILFIFFGVLGISWTPVYDLNIEENTFTSVAQNIAPDTYTLHSDTQKNIWYIGVKKATFDSLGTKKEGETTSVFEKQLCAIWDIDGKSVKECLDHDASDRTDEYYSFPVMTPPVTDITVRLESGRPLVPEDMSVYALNTMQQGMRLTFSHPFLRAEVSVISREQWGADESLRYVDHVRQKTLHQAELTYLQRPKTQKELQGIAYQKKLNEFLTLAGGESQITMSLQRFENGHRLVWPIEKVKSMDRIILHHTDVVMSEKQTDEDMIRAIYAYHAVTRGWGDIGYNYIIGQYGRVYEGRAGGDYVIGAHALYNNKGALGIAVLGNYTTQQLNNQQKDGLIALIQMLAKKYGITLTQMKKGYKKCQKKPCDMLEIVTTPALLTHRDVAITNCPGENIYTFLPALRKELVQSYTPVFNTKEGPIDPIPSDEVMNLTPQDEVNLQSSENIHPANNQTAVLSAYTSPIRYFGKKFRVLLSYPDDLSYIELKNYGGNRGFAFLDFLKKPIPPQTTLTIRPKGENLLTLMIGATSYTVQRCNFSSPVIEISSWNRFPDWDTGNKYNDNLFRDTIEIWNEKGKLKVVNHLPMEWYLKGLGEVGNEDHPEKIKTIIVAARSYATYYMDWKNRKYATMRYDGSDDPNSFQKYIGYRYEMRAPKVAKLVDTTRGEKIFYTGLLIKPWYFSSSSGRTLSYKEYCQNSGKTDCEDIPYLQSVADPGGTGAIPSGHGVGISGIGASYFANLGWDYKKIIQYYLPGVSFGK